MDSNCVHGANTHHVYITIHINFVVNGTSKHDYTQSHNLIENLIVNGTALDFTAFEALYDRPILYSLFCTCLDIVKLNAAASLTT